MSCVERKTFKNVRNFKSEKDIKILPSSFLWLNINVINKMICILLYFTKLGSKYA